MKPMPITQLGEAVLRQRARAVSKKEWARLRTLVPRMFLTMQKAKGVGIAANQVGVGLQVFIIAPDPSERYPQSPKVPPIVMINPRLLRHSKERLWEYEGCLSIPGMRGLVPRWKIVDVEFLSLDGARRRVRLVGFIARIFQHEFDHIKGMVYLDRVEDTRTLMTEREYRKGPRPKK